MAYLTYADYQSKGGTLAEAAFTRFEHVAERHIDRLTHGRIIGETTVRDAVEQLMYELIDLLSQTSEFTRAGLKSAGNGAESASFYSPKEIRAQITKLACDYLSDEETTDGLPLLYAGVDDL